MSSYCGDGICFRFKEACDTCPSDCPCPLRVSPYTLGPSAYIMVAIILTILIPSLSFKAFANLTDKPKFIKTPDVHSKSTETSEKKSKFSDKSRDSSGLLLGKHEEKAHNRIGKGSAFKGNNNSSRNSPLTPQTRVQLLSQPGRLTDNRAPLTRSELIQQQRSSATSLPRNGLLFNPAQSTDRLQGSNRSSLPI